MDRQALWDKCVAFHGHACGGLTIGFQAARYAMELLELDFSADEDVVCIAENDACGVDAIQVLLGCSVGKGNLLFHLRGKQAFSFYNRKTGKAVRLVLRPTPAEYQTKEERFRYLQDAAPAALFDVKPAVLALPERARLFQSHPCDGCGEVTAEHLLRLENGKKLVPGLLPGLQPLRRVRSQRMTLNEFFAAHPKCALGFSGGVDSAYLLYAGVRAGADLRPYYIKTAFQPRFEREDALRLAGELGVEVTVLELDALADPRVAANPAERCYYCKQNLFRALKARAAADGYTVLLDGTNASDEAGDRPGMRALRELEVRSPLRECGLTKADIRRLSREAGLFTWDKPAYACLATRIPTGEALTEEVLARVEGAEDALFRLGYTDFRVRVFHGAARLQLPAGQLERAIRERAALRAALAPYFKPILLDLEER